ncbi:hypothetical protein D3C86_2043950 [compost metagenome]
MGVQLRKDVDVFVAHADQGARLVFSVGEGALFDRIELDADGARNGFGQWTGTAKGK